MVVTQRCTVPWQAIIRVCQLLSWLLLYLRISRLSSGRSCRSQLLSWLLPSEYAYSYLSGLWSTPIIVVTQSVIEQTNKELKSYWSTPITVVTQPGLHPGIERQCLGVNSYHSCYSTMIQRAHANGLPFVNSYHSCYSTMPY